MIYIAEHIFADGSKFLKFALLNDNELTQYSSNINNSCSMDIKQLNNAADNIRVLAATMVEKAKSGHPGGAMGEPILSMCSIPSL